MISCLGRTDRRQADKPTAPAHRLHYFDNHRLPLIETAKLNDIDPQAWLTDTLARIADHKITRIDELLPWRYVAEAA